MGALFGGSPAWQGGICDLNSNTEADAVNDVVGRSFAGSPTTDPELSVDWCLGPELSDRTDSDRKEIASFFLSFSVAQHGYWVRGHTLGIRGADGELEAVCVCRKLSRAKPLFEFVAETSSYVHRLTSVIFSGKLPKVFTEDARKDVAKGVERRGDVTLGMLATMHKEHADHPHSSASNDGGDLSFFSLRPNSRESRATRSCRSS